MANCSRNENFDDRLRNIQSVNFLSLPDDSELEDPKEKKLVTKNVKSQEESKIPFRGRSLEAGASASILLLPHSPVRKLNREKKDISYCHIIDAYRQESDHSA